MHLNQSSKEIAVSNNSLISTLYIYCFLNSTDYDEDQIFWPDDFEEEVDHKEQSAIITPKPSQISNCEKESSYCENVASYPRGYVKNLVKDSNIVDTFFQNDYVEHELVNRSGSNSDQFLCPAVKRVVFPQSARNAKNKWKFIINQPEDGYVQGVVIEECSR